MIAILISQLLREAPGFFTHQPQCCRMSCIIVQICCTGEISQSIAQFIIKFIVKRNSILGIILLAFCHTAGKNSRSHHRRICFRSAVIQLIAGIGYIDICFISKLLSQLYTIALTVNFIYSFVAVTILILTHFIGLTIYSPIEAGLSHALIKNVIGFLSIAAPSTGNFGSASASLRLAGNNVDYTANGITAVKS